MKYPFFRKTGIAVLLFVVVSSFFIDHAIHFAFAETTAFTFTRELDPGMSGPDVSALQSFYAGRAEIYPEKLVTGYYGPLTERATMRFQKARGLPQVGRVGPLTLAVLNSYQTPPLGYSPTPQSSGAPILGEETVRTSPHSATFTWMTNKPANARVYYSVTWPFTLKDAPSFYATGGLSTYQSVTISGLPADKTFYYVLESKDVNGEANYRSGKTFVTQKE